MHAREALPGLGARDYWECEKKNKKKDNYVRHDTLPKVDMDKVDITKREIAFRDLDITGMERIEVELFDIDTKSGFEQVMQIANVLASYSLGASVLLLYARDWSAFSPGMRVTISAGVVTLRDNDTADTFLARADSALYSAKAQGRNRITTS